MQWLIKNRNIIIDKVCRTEASIQNLPLQKDEKIKMFQVQILLPYNQQDYFYT